MSSGNGRITVENHTGDLSVTTGNGAISISGHGGRINATSGNGDIDYAGQIAAGKENRLNSGNGDIGASITGGSISFDARSDSGKVTVNAQYTTSGSQERDHVIGVIGEAEGAASLELNTGNGKVTLSYGSDG